MRTSPKAVTTRFLPPPGASFPPPTSPGSLSASASAWLRRVLAVPTAVAMLTLGLVIVVPQLSSPVSAQTSSCAAPVTAANGPATVSAASSAFGRVLVVGSGGYAGCSSVRADVRRAAHALVRRGPVRLLSCHQQCTPRAAVRHGAVAGAADPTAPRSPGAGVNPTPPGDRDPQRLSGPGTPVTAGDLRGPAARTGWSSRTTPPGETAGANLFDPVTVPDG